MRDTWLFYHFFKLQVHILHSLENISIFNIWKSWLVRCDVIFSGTSLILPKMSKNFWSREIPLWWFPDPTLKLNNSRTAWPIPAIYISFSSILNALSYDINLFLRCSSPLKTGLAAGYRIWAGGWLRKHRSSKESIEHTMEQNTQQGKQASFWTTRLDWAAIPDRATLCTLLVL